MARESTRTPKVVLKEFDAAWKDKDQWRSLYSDAYEFALPQRNPYWHGDGTGARTIGGQRKSDRVFDSTLPNAAVKLANRLQSELCPPGRVWATMKPGEFIQAQMREQAKNELARIQAALFAAVHLSNFDQSINEWFLELVTPGTAVMAVMEGADVNASPVDFVCLPQSQVALREGPNGRIWGMYRKHRIMIALIEDQWRDAKVPKELSDRALPDKDPTAEVDLCEALYYDSKAQSWCYDVIWRDDDTRIVERDYKDGYWVVTRWIKAVGETHGRGPVIQALADAKTLNKLKELLLMNASLAVKGVWLVNQQGVINPNNVLIRPGAQIQVRGDVNKALVPLKTATDLGLAQFVVNDLRDAINMTMLNRSLPPDSAAVRSPTEIVQRLKEIQMDLGSPLGRVVTEGLIPMMQLALGVLGKAGIVPLPNGRSIPLNGGQVKFEISSPLVQAQNLADVEAVTQWASLQLSLFGKEAMLLGTKVEDAAEYLAEKMNVPPALVRSKQERGTVQQLIGTMLGQAANANGGGVGAPPGSNVVPLAA